MRNPIQPIGIFATPEDTTALMEYCTQFNGQERTIAITCAAMALNLAHKMVQEEINKGETK